MESRRNGPQLSSRHDDDDDHDAHKSEFTPTLDYTGDRNTACVIQN